MRRTIHLSRKQLFFILTCIALSWASCNNHQKDNPNQNAIDSVAANIKMYTHVWDEIINHGRLDMFNDSNFTTDVIMHVHPDKRGIDSARAYYANYLTGFSDIKFTIIDVFGQGNQLVKHWDFKGKHTGTFFGIPATEKDVDVEGVTLVKIRGGKIAEEEDFVDNLDFMQQLGIIPK